MEARTAASQRLLSSNEAERSTVFIAEEDPQVLAGLSRLANDAGWEAKSVTSIDDLLVHPSCMAPSCLLLDVEHTALDVLALQELLLDRAETTPIFMVAHSDVRIARRAKAGAFEVLTRPLRDEAVFDVVGNALNKSRDCLAQAAAKRALQERHDQLTAREQEVMSLVVSGFLNKQIAAELGISEITVKAHRGRMMRKMLANCVPALVAMSAHLQIDITQPGRSLLWPLPRYRYHGAIRARSRDCSNAPMI